jgi:hypothetical protein
MTNLDTQPIPYEPWRQDTPKKISGKVKEAGNDKEWLKQLKGLYMELAEYFLKDDPKWILGITQFYLGYVPREIPKGENQNIRTRRALKKMHDVLHYVGIQLTARICGHHAKIAVREVEMRT